MNDIDDGLMPLQVFTTAASLLELVDSKFFYLEGLYGLRLTVQKR